MPLITLREISRATVHQVCRLKVLPAQEQFVAANAVSLAEALFAPEAWYRAIYSDEQIVGFVMLWDDTLSSTPPTRPEVCLWRFMVAAPHQGQGIGRQALAAVIEHVHRRPSVSRFYSSFVPGDLGPERFYLAAGFKPTGARDEDGEVVIEYPLGRSAAS